MSTKFLLHRCRIKLKDSVEDVMRNPMSGNSADKALYMFALYMFESQEGRAARGCNTNVSLIGF